MRSELLGGHRFGEVTLCFTQQLNGLMGTVRAAVINLVLIDLDSLSFTLKCKSIHRTGWINLMSLLLQIYSVICVPKIIKIVRVLTKLLRK